MKMKDASGEYHETLIQCYLFLSKSPFKTVYEFQIFTFLDSFQLPKNGYHYYFGSEISNFRYPDKELLSIGDGFTARELEILKLIELGNSSEQIAEELCLSQFTVNAHRRNILEKSGKPHVSDVIYDLISKGEL
jgi:hypothetical protein